MLVVFTDEPCGLALGRAGWPVCCAVWCPVVGRPPAEPDPRAQRIIVFYSIPPRRRPRGVSDAGRHGEVHVARLNPASPCLHPAPCGQPLTHRAPNPPLAPVNALALLVITRTRGAGCPTTDSPTTPCPWIRTRRTSGPASSRTDVRAHFLRLETFFCFCLLRLWVRAFVGIGFFDGCVSAARSAECFPLSSSRPRLGPARNDCAFLAFLPAPRARSAQTSCRRPWSCSQPTRPRQPWARSRTHLTRLPRAVSRLPASVSRCAASSLT